MIWTIIYFIIDTDECAEGLVTIGGLEPWGSGDIEDFDFETNWCEQACENIDGGYECDCLSGYSLQENNATCKGN